MAHVWVRSDRREWHPRAIPDEGCVLGWPEPSPDSSTATTRDDASAVRIRRAPGAGEDQWALLAAPSARVLVNGLPVRYGLFILSDRDEIRLAASSVRAASPALYFATERLAVVEPYPAHDRRGMCPRCKRPLEPGKAAVRCPGCGLWHHAADDFPCWTYDGHCASCQHPTALDAGFQWTPEDL